MSETQSSAQPARIALWIVSASVLVLLLLVLSGALGERIPSDAARRGPGPRAGFKGSGSVIAEEVQVPVVERFPGTVHAMRDAVLSSRITSRVVEVTRRPGAHIQQDEVVVVLDSREPEARVQQALGALAGSEATLTEAEANHARIKTVLADKVVPQSEYDSAVATLSLARAAVDSAQNMLEQSRIELSYTTIRAPFDGIVVDRFVEPGDVAAPGVALLKVYDPGKMRLEVFVRETLAVDLEQGEEVHVSLDTLARDLTGRVEEIVPQAHAGSRSFLVKVGLPATEKLYPGMFGRVHLPGESIPRILVRPEAITSAGQLSYVTLDDEPRTRRLVILGDTAPDGRVEILSGLAAGERVLLP